jgi:hypothetical protein
LEPLTPHKFKLLSSSAIFFKFNIRLSPMPLKIMINGFDNTFYNNIEAFWSYTNPYPCVGENECDGEITT